MRFALPLTVSLLCLGLGGCGQKGPLFLPTDPPASQSAPADRSESSNAAAEDAAAKPSQSEQPQSKPSSSQ